MTCCTSRVTSTFTSILCAHIDAVHNYIQFRSLNNRSLHSPLYMSTNLSICHYFVPIKNYLCAHWNTPCMRQISYEMHFISIWLYGHPALSIFYLFTSTIPFVKLWFGLCVICHVQTINKILFVKHKMIEQISSFRLF